MRHLKSASLELIKKHIRQRDLMGLIDQLVVLLVTECANDSQITALLNYIATGDEARFNEFIDEHPSNAHNTGADNVQSRFHIMMDRSDNCQPACWRCRRSSV